MSVQFATKTEPEISAVADRRGSVLVVPVGSMEQHGPHLPVATDSILASEVAESGATRVEDVPVLVTPAVWTGYSPHHFAFGGTLSVEQETLGRILDDLAASAREAGFDALVLVNGHGGNAAVVSSAVSRIGNERPSMEVVGLTYFSLAGEAFEEVREGAPGSAGHAGEFETSLMLHLAPEHVHEERVSAVYWEAEYDHSGNDMFDSKAITAHRTMDERTESGVSGDASVADAETGAVLAETLAEEMALLLGQVHENAVGRADSGDDGA